MPDVEERDNVTASVAVVASQNLLLWSGWDEGIGAYDSIDF
jgi:hypothetical protein